MLRVSTLGRFEAVLDDRPLLWIRTHRHRSALLTLLAVDGPLPRERVASVFWPGSSPDRSRRALNQAVYDLRRLLGDASIAVHGDRIGLAGEVWVDAVEFERLCVQKRTDEALVLYRGAFLGGEHLVDSPEFESWAERRDAVLRRQHRHLRREQICELVRAGRLHDSLESALAWVVAEPDEDEAHHRVLELLAATGDRTEALQHYEAYVRTLAEQGLQPLDETRTLLESLRSGEAGALGGPVAELRAAVTPADAAGPGPDSVLAAPALAGPRSPDWPRASPEIGVKGWRRMRGPGLLLTTLVIGVAALMVGEVRSPSSALAGETVTAVGPVDSDRTDRGALAPSPTRVAVFPFRVEAGPELAWLGEELMDLVSEAVDGAGELRRVDPVTIKSRIRALRDRRVDVAVASATARELGAGQYVLGSVAAVGDSLRITTFLYAVGHGSPTSSASVSGERVRLSRLVEELARKLLDGTPPAGDR